MGEESADEKLEIIPVCDVLVRDVRLENGKLSAQSSQQLKRTLFALRFQSAIDENKDECPERNTHTVPNEGIMKQPPRGSVSFQRGPRSGNSQTTPWKFRRFLNRR